MSRGATVGPGAAAAGSLPAAPGRGDAGDERPRPPGPAAHTSTARLGALWPILVVVGLYLLPLGIRPLLLPDEFRYAEVPREMLASGDWVVPRLDGFLYFEKPVLGYWWIAASEAVFGLDRFAVRLPSALSAAATALLVALLLARGAGRRGRDAAALGALVFLTSLLVMGVGTTAVLDGPLTLWLTATLAAFFLATEAPPGSWHERGWLLAAGVACGLAFLTKGFLAFAVPALTAAVYLPWQRRWRDLVRLPWLPALAAALVAAPWSLLVHRRAPDFWPFFFWHEHVERFFGHQAGQHPQPWWFFLVLTPALMLPWTFLAPAVVRGLRREREPGSRHALRFTAVWAAVTVLFFSASSGKLATYVLPAFPALAVLVALGLAPWLERREERALRRGAATGAVIVALLSIAAAVYVATNQGPEMPAAVHSAVLLAAFAFAAVALALAARRGAGRVALLLVAVSLLPLLVAAQAALPQRVLDSKAPGTFLARHRGEVTPETLILADQNTLRAACWIFRRSDVVVVGEPGELAFGSEHPSGAGRRLDLSQARARIEASLGSRRAGHRGPQVAPLAGRAAAAARGRRAGRQGLRGGPFLTISLARVLRPRSGVDRKSPSTTRGSILAAALLLLPIFVHAASVRVEIEGVGGELRDNVRRHLSLVDGEGRRRPRRGAHPPPPPARRGGDRARRWRRTATTGRRCARRSSSTTAPGWRATRSTRGRRCASPLSTCGSPAPAATPRRSAGWYATFRSPRATSSISRSTRPASRRSSDRAAAEGYLDAAFDTAEIRIDRQAYTADVELVFDTGPRFRFGDVTFNQSFLDPDLLRGYVTFERGDPFDLRELLKMQNALTDSPYFARVETVPVREEATVVGDEALVPIRVDLTPSARQKWTAGLGYGTDTGPRGRVGLEVRRVNRHGHQAEGELLGSQVEKSFSASYKVPGAYPRTDVLTYSLGYRDLATDTSESRTGLVGAGFTRSRGRRGARATR